MRPPAVPVRWRLAVASRRPDAGDPGLLRGGDRQSGRRPHPRRLHEDELTDARRARWRPRPASPAGPSLGIVIDSPRLDDFAMADDAVVRVVDARRPPAGRDRSHADLGPPSSGVREARRARVAHRADSRPPAASPASSSTPAQLETSTRRSSGSGSSSPPACSAAPCWRCWPGWRRRRPGDAPDRLADGARQRDRHDPRPLAADAAVRAADDEVGELAADAGRDAAVARRGPDRARAGDTAPARVRRRRLARAAHAADQRARQPRAAAGLAATGDAARTARRSTPRCARRGGCAGWSSTCCCWPAPTPGGAARAPTCDLAEIAAEAARGGARRSPASARIETRERAAAAGRRQPRRAAPDGRQPARQRRPPHPRRARRSSCASRASGRGEARGRGRRRRPRHPDGMRDQVFDRFVRGEGPADTAGGGGSGLGLAIVRAVAESHGGSVEAGDRPARGGALLTVRLPAGRGAASSEPRPLRRIRLRPLEGPVLAFPWTRHRLAGIYPHTAPAGMALRPRPEALARGDRPSLGPRRALRFLSVLDVELDALALRGSERRPWSPRGQTIA